MGFLEGRARCDEGNDDLMVERGREARRLGGLDNRRDLSAGLSWEGGRPETRGGARMRRRALGGTR
jgi:hypothetical protein